MIANVFIPAWMVPPVYHSLRREEIKCRKLQDGHQAALHRMAKSIAQLTLCQVTGEEIETATKLLEKACHKLRGIPEVPPQRITDLDNATRQLHQLSCILDSCTISASYEVSEAQKNLSCL